MLFQLLSITVLILVILYLTWVKDGEHMQPPLNRRIVIDFSTVAVFWILYGLYWLGGAGMWDKELEVMLNLALAFFGFRLFQLLGQINPAVKELMEYIKDKRGTK